MHSKVRLYGNLNLQATDAFVQYCQQSYDVNEGASSMSSLAHDVDGQFNSMLAINQLKITPQEKNRIRSDAAPKKEGEAGYVNEPLFWAHYDEEVEQTKILRVKPDPTKKPLPPDTGTGGPSSSSGKGKGLAEGGAKPMFPPAPANIFN